MRCAHSWKVTLSTMGHCSSNCPLSCTICVPLCWLWTSLISLLLPPHLSPSLYSKHWVSTVTSHYSFQFSPEPTAVRLHPHHSTQTALSGSLMGLHTAKFCSHLSVLLLPHQPIPFSEKYSLHVASGYPLPVSSLTAPAQSPPHPQHLHTPFFLCSLSAWSNPVP